MKNGPTFGGGDVDLRFSVVVKNFSNIWVARSECHLNWSSLAIFGTDVAVSAVENERGDDAVVAFLASVRTACGFRKQKKIMKLSTISAIFHVYQHTSSL